MTEDNRLRVDPSWQGVIKWGGLALFAAGAVLFIFVISVGITQQTIPVPAEEALEDPLVPSALYVLAAFGELLLMPAGLALYLALKGVNKNQMLVATAFWLSAALMFLVSRGLIIALSQISESYINTADESMKAAYLASAQLAIEVQSIYAYIAIILLSVASIMIGIVLLKGGLGKRIGYVAIAAGILSALTPLGIILEIPAAISAIGLILGGVWQLIVGARLYGLGRDV